MLTRNGLKTITVVKKVTKRPRVCKQTKEIQQVIIDCILSEIVKAKEELSFNTHDNSTDEFYLMELLRILLRSIKELNHG
jgi:hypothetical protein